MNASPNEELIAAAESAAKAFEAYAETYSLPVELAEDLICRLRHAISRVQNRYVLVED